MKNKPFQQLIFFMYTLLIYFLSFFIGTLIAFCQYGLEDTIFYFKLAGEGIYKAFYLLFSIIAQLYSLPMSVDKASFCVYLAILLVAYALPFVLWHVRQSVLKAWALSLMGLLFGPGIIFFIGPTGDSSSMMGLISFTIICIFYSALYFGGKSQKQHYPNNSLANKIRFILSWPCLNYSISPRKKEKFLQKSLNLRM